MKPIISIIIPCLNEQKNILNTLTNLQHLRKQGHEIILCDASSTDNTTKIAKPLIDTCLTCKPGRATQMNAGANIANGDIFLFLHADSFTSAALNEETILNLLSTGNEWGFFNLQLNSIRWPFRIIEFFINLRSSLSHVATGDQALFITKKTFNILGGYAYIPLMEDIEITKRLRKKSNPLIIKKPKIITSSRRWEKHGILQTILLMWQLRLRYFLGQSPTDLIKYYKNNAA